MVPLCQLCDKKMHRACTCGRVEERRAQHGATEPLHVGVFRSRMRPLRIGTECSGIEAPIVALRRLGIPHVHVYSTEVNASAQVWASHNYAPLQRFRDITTRDAASLPPVDLYVCGFPCQPYSALNRKKRDDDARKSVLTCVLDAIVQTRPRVFVLENVPAFQTHAKGSLLAGIRSRCEPHYDLHTRVLCPTSFGVPQSRPRLYILGTLRGECASFDWPRERTGKLSFLSPRGRAEHARENASINDYLNHDLPIHVAERYAVRDKYYVSKIREWGFTDASPTVVCLATYGLSKAGLKGDVSPCMTAAWPGLYATRLARLLTPEEALALQGFHGVQVPPSLTHEIVRRLAGNAMSVDVLMNLFRCLLLQIPPLRDYANHNTPPSCQTGPESAATSRKVSDPGDDLLADMIRLTPLPLPPPPPPHSPAPAALCDVRENRKIEQSERRTQSAQRTRTI